MVDVLLINPLNRLDQYGAAREMAPLGLLSIAAVLEQRGYGVRVLDLEIARLDIGQVIGDGKPQVVGIAGTSVSRFEAFEIARAVKQTKLDIVTVYGGCHASFTAQDTLEHVPEIDIVARGEGELTMLELVQCVQAGAPDLSKIQGISYRENGGIRHNEPRPRIKDLDALPLPARHLIDMSGYNLKLDLIGKKAASIITSRGCPVNCSFCSASAMFGKVITRRSATNVVDEIEYVLNHYDVAGFKVFDSTFTFVPGHAESICDEILRRRLSFPWECEIRVDTVGLPLLKKMKAAGCYLVDFGIESASEKVLQRMHKGIKLAQVEQVIQWTQDVGIAQKAFFTFGHIGETMEDAHQTLEFIQKNLSRMARPSIGVGIRIYPGTEVENFALANGYLDHFSWSEPYHKQENEILNTSPNIPILTQPQMGFAELVELKRRTLQVQSANPGFVFRRILKAHSVADLKKYWQSLIKLLRLKFSRGN